MKASVHFLTWLLPVTVLPLLGNESIHFNINYFDAEGLIGTATANHTGLISNIDYTNKLQVVAGSNNDTFRIARLDRDYLGFFVIGCSTSDGSIQSFSVFRKNSGDIILVGNKSYLINIYKDSNNNIYCKFATGIEALLLLIGAERSQTLIPKERASLPSDSEELLP